MGEGEERYVSEMRMSWEIRGCRIKRLLLFHVKRFEEMELMFR